ncbi:MAG TPA: PAS domain S-box protein, partial [Methanocella sp.]|nr:PAS domain S-box protein [Methanocella sp.]
VLAEEALRESEEKFRALNEMAPVAICILQDGRFKYVNPAMEAISGYGEEELLRLDFMDMVHPSARPYIEGRYGEWLSGDSGESRSRFMGVRRDGKACWIDLSRKTIDYEGRPALLLAGVDITERVLAEEALRESEEKFRQLAETSPAAIVIYQNDRIVYVNPAAEKSSGYTAAELLSMKPWEIIHPDYRQMYVDRSTALMQGFHPSERNDLKIVTRDGRERWISASAATIMHGNQPAGLVVSFDITERKQAEEALRESEASLARAQTIAHLGSWENDYVNDTSWWSDELYDIAGLDRQRFPPTFAKFMDLVHPEDRARVEGALNATLSDGRPYNIDFRIVRPDGTERTLHSEGEAAYGRDGRPVKIFGISQDITERVRLERELFGAYNSLKEMYERKIDFTNAAAHELRTPLTPIIGYTDILKSEVKDERHRKFLAIIERNALRQKAMVNSLLELASLDAGMMQVRRSEFGVLPLASEVADNYRTINPHIVVDVGAGLAISTDPEILRHVLDNLVSNAVKYSDPAREVVIRARETGDRCEFSVTDHGQGIPREEWGKIFERFYLIGGDRDNRAGGRIGLGLALVKAYVSLLGGEVWLESELGLGSTFYFTVPKIIP